MQGYVDSECRKVQEDVIQTSRSACASQHSDLGLIITTETNKILASIEPVVQENRALRSIEQAQQAQIMQLRQDVTDARSATSRAEQKTIANVLQMM